MGEHHFTLDQGLLWHTFSFITDEERHEQWNMGILKIKNPRPLLTLRRASQVCSSWRNLILSTTSWWGRLIDLTVLDQRSNSWRIEVLRRTGESPLHIIGCVGEHSAKYFIEVLLREHWSRIRVLHLVGDTMVFDYLHFHLPKYLQHPAPSLEVFVLHLTLGFIDLEKFGLLTTPLFSDSSPSLRNFRPLPISLGTFIHAPFIAQLRKLDLSGYGISLRQLVSIFRTAHSLEELRGVRVTPTMETGGVASFEVSEITLPHLRHISLRASCIDTWLAALSNITPAPQCEFQTALRTYNDHSHQTLQTPDILAISRILSFYSKRYPNSQSPSTVLFHHGTNRVSVRHCHNFPALSSNVKPFILDTWNVSPVISDKNSFVLDTWHALPSHTASILIKSLAAYDLRSIIYLDLKFAEDSDLNPADPNFVEFISLLISVEALTLNLAAIQLILHLGQLSDPTTAHGNILPSLRTLLYPYSPDTTISLVIPEFISWRQKTGYGIEVLDLTPGVEGKCGRRDFRFLEQITGLKVRHDGVEYVCGSSNPDVLEYNPFPDLELYSDEE